MRGYGSVIVAALLAAGLLRGCALMAVKVPSGSMLPNLQIGDFVLVTPLAYGLRVPLLGGWLLRWSDPAPGDVIVFAGPRDPARNTSDDFIKRVVAVGGERVEIRDKTALVDGQPRVQPVTFVEGAHVQLEGPRDTFGPVAVPPGKLFVLGDNRDRSIDSRYWGFIDVGDVRGRAGVVYWSRDAGDGWFRWERIGTRVQ